jgi:hypothetical protein
MPTPPSPPATGAITTVTVSRRDGTQFRGYYEDETHFRITAVSAGVNGQRTNNWVEIPRTQANGVPAGHGAVFIIHEGTGLNLRDDNLFTNIGTALDTSRTRGNANIGISVGNQLQSLIMGSENPSRALAAMVGNGGPSGPLTGLNLLLSNTRNGGNLLFPTTGVNPAVAANNQSRRALVASSIAEWYADPAHHAPAMNQAAAQAALTAHLTGVAGLTAAQAGDVATTVGTQHVRISNSLRSRNAGATYNAGAPAITVPIGLPVELGGPEVSP